MKASASSSAFGNLTVSGPNAWKLASLHNSITKLLKEKKKEVLPARQFSMFLEI